MQLKLEIRANTVGELIDGLKAAERKIKVELVLRTGSNNYDTDYVRKFVHQEPSLEYPYQFSITNAKKRP